MRRRTNHTDVLVTQLHQDAVLRCDPWASEQTGIQQASLGSRGSLPRFADIFYALMSWLVLSSQRGTFQLDNLGLQPHRHVGRLWRRP